MNNNINYFSKASSLVLLAFLFTSLSTFAQIPKLFLKFEEKQNKVKSGYVKLQRMDIFDTDTFIRMQEGFFTSTPKDLQYVACIKRPKYPHSFTVSCKVTYSIVHIGLDTLNKNMEYWFDEEVSDAKDLNGFLYLTANGISKSNFEKCVFQRITPKVDKKNMRYRIQYPDQEQDLITNISQEWEFDRKTFNLIQEELSLTYDKIEQMSHRVDIFEQQLYEYIHPDILDTISFKFEEIKKGYDLQCAEEQAKKDSALREHLCDSIAQSITQHGAKWAENIPQKSQQDTLIFMPDWKFPLLSGDTLYSNEIYDQFLLIDMWYISCHPCRMSMRELSSIDTLYNESLLKILSINVTDKDTAKMSQVVRNLNLKCDVACAYNTGYDLELSKNMGNCEGYPQLYLIDMKTKQVIWHSCGWYEGFTKDIEEIIKKKK